MSARKSSDRRVQLVRVVLLAVALVTIGAVSASAQNYDQWLRQSQLGRYQPQTEDWDAILRAARTEPPLTLYTETSRAFPMLEAFEQRYGIKVEGINLRGTELIERVRREFNAGIYNAGVLMVGSSSLVYDQLLSRNAVTNYVPRDMRARLNADAADPLLVHRYSVGTWFYKNEADPNVPPYRNIWEFTTPRWRNRVAINSPLVSGTTMEYFIGLVHNSAEMERLYREQFGRPIRLTERNAGLEFIKLLLENDVRIVPAFRDVAAAVTQGQGYFAGFGAHSAYAGVQRGEYQFQLDTQIAPAVLSSRLVVIGSYTRSPNTAKLLVRWLTSQDGGSAWWGEDFAPDPSVTQTGYMADLSMRSFNKLWDTPLEVQLDLRDEIADLFLLYQ